MKNFLKSVLLGLLIGIIYIGTLVFIISPLLFKEGFIGLMLGKVNVSDFIRNVLGQTQSIPYKLDPYSIAIIIVQILLFLTMCIATYIFLSKVLKELLTGEGEEYFQSFYKIIYMVFSFCSRNPYIHVAVLQIPCDKDGHNNRFHSSTRIGLCVHHNNQSFAGRNQKP